MILIHVDIDNSDDYGGFFYPSHVLGMDKSLVQIFIGRVPDSDDWKIARQDPRAYGIYIKDIDYEKVNHAKPYIFLHDPEGSLDSTDIDFVLEDIKNEKCDYNHIHIFSEAYDINKFTKFPSRFLN